MKKGNVLIVFILLIINSYSSKAQLTGEYRGYTSSSMPTIFTLNTDGKNISGTVKMFTWNRKENYKRVDIIYKIISGLYLYSNITFDMEINFQGTTSTASFTGKFNGMDIEGQFKSNGGEAPVRVTKVNDISLENENKFLSQAKKEYIQSTEDNEREAFRDGLTGELNNLGAIALQYYNKPVSMNGGGNSFIGFVIPEWLKKGNSGNYKIENTYSQKINIIGTGNVFGDDSRKYIQYRAVVTPPSNVKIIKLN